MATYKNAYDSSPKYKNAVVRTWSHDYGGAEGLAEFATVWDAERAGFYDYCIESGDHLWGGDAFEDATPKILAKWMALPEAARAPVPPAQQPRKGDLLERKYGA